MSWSRDKARQILSRSARGAVLAATMCLFVQGVSQAGDAPAASGAAASGAAAPEATASGAGLTATAGPPLSPAERGRYLAIAGNCASCHTAPGGEALAGGVQFATPFGKLYSTNITPDPETGIGRWTAAQFREALRKGVRPDGQHLYPVFPYPSFTNVTDADSDALFAYLRSVPAVRSTPPANDMSFPYNQRWLMSVWNMMYLNEGPYKPDTGKSAQWNRGAYLVTGLLHCSACHSPRNFLGAESTSAALTGGIYQDKIASGELRNWSTPNLTPAADGLASWPLAEISSYLKTGRNAFVETFGPMNEVILNSTSHLSDSDVQAVAFYLKSLPPQPGPAGTAPDKQTLDAGATLYDVHCGTCHLPTGLGSEDTGTRLAGNPVVQASDPSSLINTILYGPPLPDPPLPAKWKAMEGFGDTLSDDEVAQLSSYLRSTWGNKGGAVTAAQVAKQR